jgi:hypothetical protein
MSDSRPDTYEHIGEVRGLVLGAAADLMRRAHIHDASKLVEPEVSVFDEVSPRLRKLTYGSDEYKASLAEMGEALAHHYAENRHHPEHGEQDCEWRPVAEYEGFYEVSSYGDVRSLDRKVEGRGGGHKAGQYRRFEITPKGYRRVALSRDGAQHTFMVHRLVAQAFIPNPGDKPEVNHRNGDKADNRAENLEWATSSENQQHAYETGLREPAIKYVVRCVELDLTTFGCVQMEGAVRARGYPKVGAAGIWNAMDRGGKHFDLTFEGTALADWRRSRVRAMTLLDLVEMLCDWLAATRRHDDGDIHRSIDMNQERFGYSDELKAILHSTVSGLLLREMLP